MQWTLRRILFGASVVVQLAVLYAPTAGNAPGWPGFDKLVHVAVFAAVALTGRAVGIPAGWLGGVLAGHAVLSELVQHFLLPHRSGDPADVVADWAGVAGGLAGGYWSHVRGLPDRSAPRGHPRAR